MISLCLIIRNEEKALSGYFSRIKSEFDEIIIVDTGSIDNSLEIATKITDKVYSFRFDGNFSEVRNYAISKTKNPWILFLDADEEIDIMDLAKIRNMIQMNEMCDGYYLFWVNYVNKNTPQVGYKLSLFRKHPDIYYEGLVHEQPIYSIRSMKGKLKLIDCTIKHYCTDKTKEYLSNKEDIYINLLKRQIELGIHEVRTINYLSSAYWLKGHKHEAINLLKNSLELKAEPMEKACSYFFLGTLCKMVGDVEETINNYQHALQICKENMDDIEVKAVSRFITSKIYHRLALCLEKKNGSRELINRYYRLAKETNPMKEELSKALGGDCGC